MRLILYSGCAKACFTLILLALSGCMINQSPVQQLDAQAKNAERQQLWQAHRSKASKLVKWKVRGKIAVKAGRKGGHATLRWHQTETLHIELFGPLGGGRVVIDSDTEGARLQDTKGADLKGESVSALIAQRLGWPLPFDLMAFWLRGLPVSKQAMLQWDDKGRIQLMNDRGWQVSYQDYQTISYASLGEIDVPSSIELNALPGTLRVYANNGEYLGEDLFIRLIIKAWLPG